jgi:Dolichyl-phosphate-mannose-protein mannosyltransferase
VFNLSQVIVKASSKLTLHLAANLSGYLRWITILLVITFFFLYIFAFGSRLFYPYDLQFLESGIVSQTQHLLDGKKLYTSPSLEYTPFIYGPLYFYVSAFVAKFLGLGYFPLRLVSIMASFGCFFFLFSLVKRETNNIYAAFLSAGIYAATYKLSAFWFDLARVDSLFLCFLLAAIYFFRVSKNYRDYVFAALLFFLSFLAKQTTIIICLPLLLYLLLTNWKRFFVFSSSLFVLLLSSSLFLNNIYNGWYTYYTIELPNNHSLEYQHFLLFWIRDLGNALPIFCFVCILYFIILVKSIDKAENKDQFIFYFSLAIGMLAGAWSGRLHSGGSENVLFPAYACIALISGLALSTLLGYIEQFFDHQKRGFSSVVFGLFAFQFLVLLYNPLQQVPTNKSVEAGKTIIERISKVQGSVYIPYHNYYAKLAKKPSYAHGAAIGDVIRGDKGERRQKLIEEINSAVKEQKFYSIILDTDWSVTPFDAGMFQQIVNRYYIRATILYENNDVFWSLSDLKTRPEYIFTRR